jgi:hypothetical protein
MQFTASDARRINSSPRHAIPEFVHFLEESPHVSAVAGREESWDIFEEDPLWLKCFNEVEERKREDRPLTIKPPPLASAA